MKKIKYINVLEEDACPGDELMKLYRDNPEELRKNVLFSQTSIDFFKRMADVVERDKRITTFFWSPIMEENIPSLKIKVQKEGKQYRLLYLKEKVTYKERQNEFKGRVTLNINQSKLKKKSQKGTVIFKKENDKREIER